MSNSGLREHSPKIPGTGDIQLTHALLVTTHEPSTNSWLVGFILLIAVFIEKF